LCFLLLTLNFNEGADMKKLFILLAAMLTFTSTAFAQIGSASTDLVFTPITPCRIVDTRTSQGGTGPITTGTIKGFLVWGVNSYASQGGSATNCGLLAPGANVAAVAVSMAVAFPAGTGWLTAFPGNIADAARPLAATLNFNAGEVVVSNAATLKVAQSGSPDLKVFASNTTEVIIDVVGFYSKPIVGSFTCTTTPGVTVAIAANGTNTAFASSCAAGATLTGTNCRADSFDVFFAVSDNGQCSAKNTSGAAHNITAEVRCCQVPGR
jgi:hypothetical protein